MLANEVLDALPVHLLVWRDRSVYERGVVLCADEFAWEERPASDALLELAENVRPETDVSDAPYVSEVCPAVTGLISGLTGLIESGILMVIDYGFPRTEYFHPQRSSGTLMCHYRHHVHDDPFFLPGLQDITAHVDFTLVAEAGVDAGCTLAGYTTQAQFLLNCGITGLLAQTSPEDVAAYLPQSTAVQKLLSPAEMGELFKVMALTRGIDGPLLGFQEGDRSARL